VVFPAPRKPDKTVTGRRSAGAGAEFIVDLGCDDGDVIL
jgi:hypothetical protein